MHTRTRRIILIVVTISILSTSLCLHEFFSCAYLIHCLIQIWVLVYKWGTEKIWGIYGEFVDKINIFPINYQYIINKMPTQLKINCFPINYLQILLYFNKFSLFYPLQNQHFFNIPTYCQQIFLNQACKASNLMGQGEIYYYG